jgi:hypothetical protein
MPASCRIVYKTTFYIYCMSTLLVPCNLSGFMQHVVLWELTINSDTAELLNDSVTRILMTRDRTVGN